MAVIDPEYLNSLFRYSLSCLDCGKEGLKKKRLSEENVKKLFKIVVCLRDLEKIRWSQIPSTDILYSGSQANQIKLVIDKKIKHIIENAFAESEYEYQLGAEHYPSYLSITKEIRLFGYQWKGKFHIVIIDLEHVVLKRS